MNIQTVYKILHFQAQVEYVTRWAAPYTLRKIQNSATASTREEEIAKYELIC